MYCRANKSIGSELKTMASNDNYISTRADLHGLSEGGGGNIQCTFASTKVIKSRGKNELDFQLESDLVSFTAIGGESSTVK